MSNEALPASGDRARLWQRIAVDAGRYTSSAHFWADGGYRSAPWPEVVRDAERMTAGLRRAGVRPGARVATMLTNGPATARALLGIWLAGGVVASLPTRMRGMDADEYARQISDICGRLDAVQFLVEQRVLDTLPEPLRVRARTFESFAGTGQVEPSPPGEDEPAFVQYSSGSTSEPKGCVLTPRAIAAQLDMLADLLSTAPGEPGVGWLPWSHDMGMFGNLLTGWWNDSEAYFSTPERFLFSPRTWVDDMARYEARITAGTPTALRLTAVTAARRSSLPGPLGVRCVILGAERVSWEVLEHATTALEPFGFDRTSLMPAYGLAEATLALTSSAFGERTRHVTVDSVALADGRLDPVDADDPSATRLVEAGRPCAGVEMVMPSDPDTVAAIRARSPALAIGYHDDERRTAAAFTDGVLSTGDLGVLLDGHLYPVGRHDDLIPVDGRNVYAREIENEVDAIEGVRHGCSTLIGRHEDGSLRLTLFLEVANRRVDHAGVARRAASVAMAKAAVALDECVFLPRNALPKTPSGKIQRHRCLLLMDTGGFEPVATIRLAR